MEESVNGLRIKYDLRNFSFVNMIDKQRLKGISNDLETLALLGDSPPAVLG